jgi:hypothetical protein
MELVAALLIAGAGDLLQRDDVRPLGGDRVGLARQGRARAAIGRPATFRRDTRRIARVSPVTPVPGVSAAEAEPTQDDLDNALWCAAHGGRREAAEVLIDRGADPAWVGHDNFTAAGPGGARRAVGCGRELARR